MDMTAIDLNAVIAEFEAHRLGQEVEGCQYREAELAFFRDIVEGVVRQQRVIDPLVDRHLAQGSRLNRVDSILRAILRGGAYEMLMRKDVPSRVVITEYVDLAHAFFEGEEPKVVNGILDKLAREIEARGLPGRRDGVMINGVEHDEARKLGEFEIIARYFAPLAKNPAALGLLDDAAVLAVPEGHELVLTTDTIIEGVHFLAGDSPASIGHKALAVDLSDLAPRGTRPEACLSDLAFARPALQRIRSRRLALRGSVSFGTRADLDLVDHDTFLDTRTDERRRRRTSAFPASKEPLTRGARGK